MYHLSTRRRSRTSTREKPSKLLQATKQGPEPIPRLHSTTKTTERTKGHRGYNKPTISCPVSLQNILLRHPVALPPLMHPCGALSNPLLSLSQKTYSSAKAASIRPVKHKCTTQAQCSSITHATRSLSERVSNQRSQLGQRLRIEKARGSKRRGRTGGGVGAFLLKRACAGFSRRGSAGVGKRKEEKRLCQRGRGPGGELTISSSSKSHEQVVAYMTRHGSLFWLGAGGCWT